jgi:hypothetical protein
MLETRCYEKAELAEILGNSRRQDITRKLDSWGIAFTTEGRGKNLKITITEISNPFKVFCITELGFAPQTDFNKLREFYYYYFCDEEFMAMPDEVKEARLNEKWSQEKKENGTEKSLTRQTIAGYEKKLRDNDLIYTGSEQFIYYFAKGNKQRIVEKEEYLKAWHEYFENKKAGASSKDAINIMFANYGGVARKQAIPQVNAFYLDKINRLIELIGASIEADIIS